MAKIGTPLNRYMPELPEVETIKRYLTSNLKDKTITSIEVIRNETILSDVEEFKSKLTNTTFKSVKRIGKFLLFFLSNNLVIISHLRMEGKYYLLNEEEKKSSYAKVILHLNSNEKLIYDDSRCFGFLKLSNKKEYLKEKEIAKLGKEPSEIVDIDEIFNKVKDSSLTIKELLLDQTLIAGIGNIYADEILYVCNIHPLTIGKFILRQDWINIVEAARKIFKKSIALKGSTIKSYHPTKDETGNYQKLLKAYGKEGEICPKCKSRFVKIKVNGRGTTYCPKCQKKKGAPLKVGIFGKIASGKSEVLAYFKSVGFPCISSDSIVTSLYKDKIISNNIAIMFNLSFSNTVDKNMLREYLSNHPNDIRKINNYVHPLVREEIEKFFKKNNKKDIVIAEVPLLFEAHYENMFDFIIGVDVDKKTQVERLTLRDKENSKKLYKINNKNTFGQNKSKADFIINNNLDLKNLKIEVDKIISKVEEYLDLFPTLHLL